ncbi:MAG: N-6 DNA methylase, partial [Spirochaetota bacterium]
MIENRIYQAYYTKSEPITNYMISLLELKGNEKILEPCAGDGVFMDSILEEYPGVCIEALELNTNAYLALLSKYRNKKNVIVKNTDTLIDPDLERACSIGGFYDAIIANPPYGAWRDKVERQKLKKFYDGFYVKESYTLFMYRCIEALNAKGRLAFIIPDTYLNLHMHKGIREYILKNTKIKEISLFPSSYFPGVNFGYANLSIICLEKSLKSEDSLKHKFIIRKGFKSVDELGNPKLEHLETIQLKQQTVLETTDFAIITNGNKAISNCIKVSLNTIGDICDCVTGFYSGNDKENLKVRSKEIRNAKKYEVVDLNEVQFNCGNSTINGINGKKKFVPIVKGGNTKYYKPDNWFMLWTKDKVAFYKNDKKARYQNSNFYFKKGIAVPMVSSTCITAALLDKRLFDQSIVGIFPKEEELLLYLLAFLNSPTCNKLIRTINPSTNNSSNYIKKIPFVKPNKVAKQKVTNNTIKILARIQ